MRNLISILAAVLLSALLAAAVGCKPESPGPTPEPTEVPLPEATIPPAPDPNVAVCFTPGAGAPGGGVCKNADGQMVTCPADTSGLPVCP